MKKNRSGWTLFLAVLICISCIASLTCNAYADGIYVEPVQGIPFPPTPIPEQDYSYYPEYTAPDYSYEYYQYLYPYSHTGTLVCSRATVRKSPSASSGEYGKLKNGQTCVIVGKYNEWLIIDLASCNFNSNPSGYGYVKEGLIKSDPYWIVTTQYTYLYATPWQSANLRNGEQSNRVFLVIEENYPFYAVQCTESTAGSSFIYQWDIGRYSKDGQDLYVIAEDKVPILDGPYGRQTSTLERFTIVNVTGYNGEYYYVTVNVGTNNEFSGWVKSQYCQKIIN